MRAVLCKNVPAMRDFRDVICPAAWKNPSSVCGHVALFPVLPEIFFGFPAFRGRNFGRDFLAGRGKMVAGFIFSSSVCHKTGRFLGNSCPPVGKNGLSREILVLRLAKKWPFWEISVLLLAKNGDFREIFLLRLS